jgi:putative molybdopterin biosynthesis protein
VTKNTAETSDLHLTALADALHLMQKKFLYSPRIARIPVQNSYGKITAEAVISPLSVPAAHLSAMDGIAIQSRDTRRASDKRPVRLTGYHQVCTGNVIPSGYDAVIMTEDLEEKDGAFLIRSPVPPWQHIRPAGEDIAATEMILPRFTRIRENDMGAMASYGITTVPVLELKVALIPTGNDIVPVGTVPQPGQVIESNMYMAAGLITAAGGKVSHYSVVPDDNEKIRKAVKHAADRHDIILISAGSYKGSKDRTAQIIEELGSVFVHGIAMKPGKPVVIGEVNRIPVIGMPGYPSAFHVVLREIVMPLLGWYGFSLPPPDEIPVKVTNTVCSDIRIDEFVPVAVGKIQNTWVAVPLPQGPGVQMNSVRSNGYLKIPSGSSGPEAGTKTQAYLTVRKHDAGQVVLVTGSHDPSLDYLADLVRTQGISLASSHVGSMGGLHALQQGDCHLAPMHLLAGNNEYNIPYLRENFPDQDFILACVGERQQGIVSRDVLGFDDITRYRFINRQKGSGTRTLLDHLLKQKGISPKKIHGYDEEVTTHLGVCLAIQSGDADLGMTVYAAARAFSLPFLAVALERYELVTTKQMYDKDPRIRAIFDMIGSQKFREVLIHLGGYETENTGVIRTCNRKRK